MCCDSHVLDGSVISRGAYPYLSFSSALSSDLSLLVSLAIFMILFNLSLFFSLSDLSVQCDLGLVFKRTGLFSWVQVESGV